MKYMRLILAWFLLNPTFGFDQSNKIIELKNKIEISSIIRYDFYRQFSYNLGRTSDDNLIMRGLSWGINVNYKKALTPQLFLKAGIGFYRYTFNKLSNENSIFGHSTSRAISYPSPLLIMFYTDHYWYNTLSANFGFEHFYPIRNNIQIVSGLNVFNYFSFSQHYHLTYNNIKYNTHDINYFGSSVNTQIGFIKKVGHLQIGPSVIIPIYDKWKKDTKFGDISNEPSEKWFNGIGINFTFSKMLKF